jgi:ribonuclease D
MPALTTESRLIHSQANLVELCDSLNKHDVIAVDTEFVRTNTYWPKLCLIQLATDERIGCVDLLAKLDATALLEIICGDTNLKIFHAAKQDLEAIYSTYGQLPGPLIDTQICAGLLGYPSQIGYANLVQKILDVQLDKAETRTDWSRRPLTAAQIDYAADDVVHLAAVYENLKDRLEADGRYGWALEDSAALVDQELYDLPSEDAWRRLSRIRYLKVPAQARARRMTAWRERRAKKLNRPRQWILTDKIILKIANENPRDADQLRQIPELPPGLIRNQGEIILKELRSANEAVTCGTIEFGQEARPLSPDPQALKHLAGIVAGTADKLGIAADILATRKDLTALLRGIKTIRPLTGWRRSIIGETLLQAL